MCFPPGDRRREHLDSLAGERNARSSLPCPAPRPPAPAPPVCTIVVCSAEQSSSWPPRRGLRRPSSAACLKSTRHGMRSGQLSHQSSRLSGALARRARRGQHASGSIVHSRSKSRCCQGTLQRDACTRDRRPSLAVSSHAISMLTLARARRAPSHISSPSPQFANASPSPPV